MYLSQWQRLLKNEGVWQGSFTQLSPSGEVVSTVPSEVSLLTHEDGKLMRQTVRKHPDTPAETKQVFEYRTLGRGILLCEDGAFSNGSMQWGPFSDFGAELGLIWQDRRLRIAQVFEQGSALKSITLIREQRAGSTAPERSPLQVSDLLGRWTGTATTLYADYRPDTTQSSTLTVEKASETQIRQTLELPDLPPISSTGELDGSRILFTSGIQVLLLADGGSCTCPIQIEPRQPLFLEMGCLVEPNHRLRLIRRYDTSGRWVSLTQVDERRIDA